MPNISFYAQPELTTYTYVCNDCGFSYTSLQEIDPTNCPKCSIPGEKIKRNRASSALNAHNGFIIARLKYGTSIAKITKLLAKEGHKFTYSQVYTHIRSMNLIIQDD